MIFGSLYHSFKEFYETFFRGNEVEFVYKGEKFHLLPIYNECKVVKISFGTIEDTDKQICSSIEELYNIRIGENILGKILNDIDIVWHNI